jgi:glutathione S-transferase
MYQWVLFGMTEVEAQLYRSFRAERDGAPENLERERFDQAATALENALGENEWLLGDHRPTKQA